MNMTGTEALIYFAAWTLMLVTIVVLYRTSLVFTGKTVANSWTRGAATATDPAWVTRFQHAHLNALENLPIFAAIVIAASVMSKLEVVDKVGAYVLFARLAQTIVHLIAVNHWMVMLRATLYTVQALLFFYMMWGLLH